MSVVLHPLFVALSVLTAIITFVSVIAGDDGEEKVKKRLEDWWAWVGDHGFRAIITSSAMLVDNFFSTLLGTKIVSPRALATWWGVCCVVPFCSSFVFIPGTSVASSLPLAIITAIAFTLIVGLVMACIDFPFLAVSRFTLRAVTATKNPRKLLLIYFLNSYVSYIIGSDTIFVASNTFRNFNKLFDVMLAMGGWLLAAIISPVHTVEQLFALMFLLSVTLSTSLIAPVIIVALLLQSFRKQTEPIAIWILERAAGSKKGLFAGVTALLTAVTGLLAAVGVKGQ